MTIEKMENRDVFMKICVLFFLNHVLTILGIVEEIVDILPTEEIDFKRFGKNKVYKSILDFKALTKSDRILIFEFKKNALRKKDLKQSYRYYQSVLCKNDKEVRLIIIVLSKGGKIATYDNKMITFHPEICKVKHLNKQEDLKIIRNKFINNIKLTITECALLVTLPLFDLVESEEEIVKEVCKFIKYNKNCIPEEMLDKVIFAHYLNIVEYIDEDEQEIYMEMIDMGKKVKGAIAKFKEELKEQLRDEVEQEVKEEVKEELRDEVEQEVELKVKENSFKEIFNRWLDNGGTIEEISAKINMPPKDINRILHI